MNLMLVTIKIILFVVMDMNNGDDRFSKSIKL